MLPQIFQPSIEDLARLSPQEAVATLWDMLHAEASYIGLAPTFVSVPSDVFSSDGGVDAQVSNAIGPSLHGLIFPGRTCYQVKTGAFSFSKATSIRSILFKPEARRKKPVVREDLQPRVKACFDDNGTFVLVLFGSDAPERSENQHVNAIKKELNRVTPPYKDPKIRIWYPNQIAKLSVVAPARALRLRGVRAASAIHDVEWMGKSCGLDGAFVQGDKQSHAIGQIRAAASKSGGLFHVRLVGEPGIGKTRILYEALKAPAFSSITLYCPDGDQLIESGLLDQLQILVKDAPLILAVDECSPESRTTIHKRLRSAGPAVTLVSVYSELDDQDARSPDYHFLEAPKLTDDQVTLILKGHGVPADKASIVAPLCDGSPRVAHSVGKSLATASSVQDLLSPADLDNIWDHFIAGTEGRRSPHFLERHTVLCCLALFKRFGWADIVKSEAKQIHELFIAPIDSRITWSRFVEIVEQLQHRRILQGRTTLYITPRLLHIKLWCDWWERHSSQYDIPAVFSTLDRQLREWLAEMFVYARESPPALRVVEKLFGKDGPYRDLKGFFGEFQGLLFFKLAQAHPKAALRTLRQALGDTTTEERRSFSDGRRYVVHALEHIALYGECFVDAAECLLLLAETENEDWGNNATGVFKELFGLGYGRMAATQLSPIDRLPILIAALHSGTKERIELALGAFEHALRTQFVRTSLGETHGLRELPQGWTPANYGELWSCYKTYVEALWAERKTLPAQYSHLAPKIILGHARALIRIPTVAPLVAEILRTLAKEGEDSVIQVIDTVVGILHYDSKDLNDDLLGQIQDLNNKLTGNSFRDRLRRYVRLNLLEDKFNEAGAHEDQAAVEAAKLAALVIESPSLLAVELDWLVTGKAQNGYIFGFELGQKDVSLKLWPDIFGAWERTVENRSDFFVGGYLGGIHRRDPKQWDEVIGSLASKETTELPTLIWRSGMTPRAASLLLDGLEKKHFDPIVLRLLIYGAVIRDVPRNIAVKFVRILINTGSRKYLDAALELYYSGFMDKKDVGPDSLELAYEITMHDAFFGENSEIGNAHVEYSWKEVSLFLLEHSPEKALSLGRKSLEHMGAEGGVFEDFMPQSLEFLNALLVRYPEEMWKHIVDFIGPPIDTRAYHILQWLRGESGFHSKDKTGPLNTIPRELISNWIAEKPDPRAWYVAHYSPFALTKYGEIPKSLIREVLELYGNVEEVRRAAHANYHTEGWTGPASAHHQQKRAALEQIRAVEKNSNVKIWLDAEIENLDKMVSHEQMDEERRGF